MLSRSSSTDRRAPNRRLTPNTSLNNRIASPLQSHTRHTLPWIICSNRRIRITTRLDAWTSSRRTTDAFRHLKRTSTRNLLKILNLNFLNWLNLYILFCSDRRSTRRSCLWSYLVCLINRSDHLNCRLSSTHPWLSGWPSRGPDLTSWDAHRNFLAVLFSVARLVNCDRGSGGILGGEYF
jgi:hypothetical protein